MKRIFWALGSVLMVAMLCARPWNFSDAATRPAPAGPVPDVGIDSDLRGFRAFPADDPWNTDISKSPVDPNSDGLIKFIGADKPLHADWSPRGGIPYVVVGKGLKPVPVKFTDFPDESEKGPYPIPPTAPIEGGGGDGDCHVLVLDRDAGMLYEMWHAKKDKDDDGWSAANGAVFDLSKPLTQRPEGWTSGDAAGLAILPGLVRYDEVMLRHKIEHALRFTIQHSRQSFIPPARHAAGTSSDKDAPPMGMRVRLKANFNISRFPPGDQVILQCLKTYGMILADNGSDWYISGSPDPRWDMRTIGALSQVKGKDLEVVKMESK